MVTLDNKETAQDMADFVEYVYGPPDSPWGARRVRDRGGNVNPYKVRVVLRVMRMVVVVVMVVVIVMLLLLVVLVVVVVMVLSKKFCWGDVIFEACQPPIR